MNKMKDIRTIILLYLSQHYDWATAKAISQSTDTSIRSVKYYIKLINEEAPDAIISSNKGYKINRVNMDKTMASFMYERKPINYLERKKFILRELLITGKTYDLSELADELFISTATLQNELSRIRCELLPRKIKLHIRKDIISISGERNDLQSYYLEMIKGEVQENLFQLESIQQMFNNVDLRIIEKVIKEELDQTQYLLDNYSLMSLILHIGLLIEFQNRASSMNEGDVPKEDVLIKEHVTQSVVNIFKELKKTYDFEYSAGDIFETSMLFMSKLIFHDVDGINEDTIKSYVGKDVSDLLQYIADKVYKNYSIDLTQQKFLVRFSFHLQKLLIRAKQELPSSFSNSYIKNDYPMMYSVATYIAYLISKKTGLTIVEDEIAYIALHIGVMIDEENESKNRLNCVIFSPDYYLLGESIYEKLESTFSNYLNITSFITTYMELETISNVDIIISTAHVRINTDAHVIVISKTVSFHDIQGIYAMIENINRSKHKAEVISMLNNFYTRDLFFYNVPAQTDEDIVNFLCDRMYEKKLVNKSFKRNIYEREKVAKSCYGNIAIPHPLTNDATKSAIAISIHPKALKWGDNKVNLVIMLSISEKDNTLFSRIFDLIAKPISNDEKVAELMKIDTYDGFIDFLTSDT